MKFIRMAEKAALNGGFYDSRNRLRFRMGAVLARGGSVIATGYNEKRYCSYAARFREHADGTMHAEVRAILNLPKSVTRGCDMYVVRLSSDGKDLKTAKPCNMCTEVLRRAGIRRVFYTEENEIHQMRL